MGTTDLDAIQIYSLSKRFRKVIAVNNASFTVRRGDVFGLLGPNGAGKTTIIRMLVGLIKPSAGAASVFGFDPQTQRREVLLRTSAILEAPALYPRLSGYDNLRAMGYASGMNDLSRIHEVVQLIGMADRAKDRFETYSLGMKQRLCIAASLLTNPDLIILDEPTNGLDPAGMRDIRDLIKNLAQQGRTVLLSSHLLNEVQQVCNRVAILQRGGVIAEGSVSELLSGHASIRIRVQTDEQDKALAILQKKGWQDKIQVEDGYLIVNSPAEEGAALNEALATNGIFASEIKSGSISLEEYYLSLTGANGKVQESVKQPA
jgi:ABC-2 type transport system ATP-binding protein